MRPGFAVLAVDDDSNYLMLIEHAWLSIGTTNKVFQSATSGDEAIEYLKGEGEYSDRNRFPDPGLIMLDLRMPQGDGFSVLERLKSKPEWATIRTVVLTGSAQPDDIRKAYLLGACAYHVKPNTYEDLAKLLKAMFDYWPSCEIPQADIVARQPKTNFSPKP